MKKIVYLVAFIALSISFSSVCVAQKKITVGGYKSAAVDNKEIVEAADFAVEAQQKIQDDVSISLVSIEKAERQLVQGTNFRLCLNVQSGEDEEESETKSFLVVVYRDLKNQFSLRSWTEKDCAE